jgi:hypothetical protein
MPDLKDTSRTPVVVPIATPFAVTAKAAEHFMSRGLTQAEVAQLKLTIIDAAQMDAALGFRSPKPKASADRIPYFDIDGSELLTDKKQVAVRFRRHLPPGSNKDEVGGKYLQAKGTGCFAYLPQNFPESWSVIAADPGIPLLFTEGEYKAITACQQQLLPTIGLAGVWSFKGKHGLCTPLHKFQWEGRQVFVAFDADAESTRESPFKNDVQRALTQFCAMLEARGAKVEVLHIAQTEQFKLGEKMGLDDYLKAGGSIEALMETRTPAQLAPALAAMMEKYAFFIGTKPHVLHLDSGATFSAHDFSSIRESTHKTKNPVTGNLMKVSDLLREHPQRQVFDRYVFDPSTEGGLDQARGVFNHWPGLSVQPKHNAELEAVYVRFMEAMCGPHFNYVVNWFAHMVQRPWEKTTIAMLCMSPVNGSGKSIMGELHGALLGGQLYASVPLLNVLSEKFNGELANKLFVQADEADQFHKNSAAALKNIISALTIRIEKKNRDAEILSNLMRLFITTNSPNPLRLDAENRRLFVWTPKVTKAEARGKWGAWVGKDVVALKNSPEGLAAVMHYLLERDLSDWNPTAPVPVTAEMQELVDASPTKNMSTAQAMYDDLEAEGVEWVFVPAALNSADVATFVQFRELVKAGGGQKLRHTVTRQKKVIKGAVYDLRGSLKVRMDGDSHAWVAAGQLGGEQVEATEQRMQRLFAAAVHAVKPFVAKYDS